MEVRDVYKIRSKIWQKMETRFEHLREQRKG